MSDFIMWSAPEEPYEDHIRLSLGAWDKFENRILPTLCRLFEKEKRIVLNAINFTIVCHDVGKLTQPWQTYIHKPKSERNYKLPHATLGAPYLLNFNDRACVDLNCAAALAILMHHTDSGLAQGNLEHPAEDAINRGLVQDGTDNIRWAAGAEDVFQQTLMNVPDIKQSVNPLKSVVLNSLEDMAYQLRLWARCPKEIERHQHRMQALAIHHILKVCDWRAASQRPDTDEEGEEADKKSEAIKQSILQAYLEGGLVP